jgi:hypothetical protein
MTRSRAKAEGEHHVAPAAPEGGKQGRGEEAVGVVGEWREKVAMEGSAWRGIAAEGEGGKNSREGAGAMKERRERG